MPSGPVLPLGNPSTTSPVLPNSVPLNGNLPSGFTTPTFDPYAPALRPSTTSGVFPQNSGGLSNPFGNLFGFGNSAPVYPQPTYPISAPVFPNSSTGFPTSGAVLPGSNSPVFPNSYPSTVYPNTMPPALFPGGTSGSGWGTGWNTGATNGWNNGWGSPNPGWGNGNAYGGSGWYNNMPNGPLLGTAMPQPMRFFLGPRFRHTWVQANDDPTSLETNDSDVSLVFAIPNFFLSNQPLYVVPSFSFHTFEGPRLAGSDIPANAYSGFVDFGWESDPIRTFGLELGVRAGVFTDFDTFSSDSIRVMGKALGRIRLTPNATLRAGVFYIDRNRYKLVPAGGILWVPNPETRFDIFFPEPKLSHYLSTIGTTDMWWYLTGYYGGGTWTIDRGAKGEDSIDINEARIALGLDFGRNDLLRQGRRLYFFEAGYAFNRELLFRYNPADNTDLKDGFVLRAGFGY